MSEWKACPFCGNKDILSWAGWRECRQCHCQMHPDEWNTRPLEDALNKRIAELEERIQGMNDRWTRDWEKYVKENYPPEATP